MHSFAVILIASLLAISTTTRASPVVEEKRQIESVSITFYDANEDSWSQVFPTDLSPVEVENNTAIVTHIYNPGGASCVFSGAEGGTFNVPINDHVLDNPQPLVSGFCGRL